MKKLSLLFYYILFIIYEEVVLSCLLFKTFPISIWLIALFSIPIAIVLNILSSMFKPRANKIIAYVITAFVVILFGAQIVYYTMYESILSFYSILNGGQVTEFMDVIFDMILRNWYGILLFALPIIVLIILHKTKIIDFENKKIKEVLIEIGTLILVQTIAILCVNFINTDDIYSNKNLYYNVHVPKLMTKNMGFLTSMKVDLYRFAFGFEEKLALEVTNQLTDDDEKIEYNVVEIDFDNLIGNEKNESIKSMHEYFSNIEPTKKNKYTGMFEGKNLVVLVGESFSNIAIDKELTPNLYKLYNEGFQFDNFYTPVFPVSTADGEYITDTSLIPKEGVWSFKEIVGNTILLVIATLLVMLISC